MNQQKHLSPYILNAFTPKWFRAETYTVWGNNLKKVSTSYVNTFQCDSISNTWEDKFFVLVHLLYFFLFWISSQISEYKGNFMRWWSSAQFNFKALYRIQVGELVGWGEVCPCRGYLIWCGILKADLEKYNYFTWPWFELKLKYKIKVLYLKKK